MPLQAMLEAAEYDALPDTTVLGKDSFAKNDEQNKFFLNLPPDEAGKLAFNLQKSIAKLTDNNKELLKQKGEANTKAQAFELLGKTPDEIKELIESKRPEDVQKLVEAHKEEIAKITRSFEEPLTAAKTKAEKLEAQVRQSLASSEISKLVTAYDLDPETAPAILERYIKPVPVDEGSDEYVTRVFDNGQPALIAGQPMTTEQLIKGWIDNKKYQAIFRAGTGGGGGADGRQQSSGGGSIIRVSREASKTNPGLYQQAKAQAEKTGAQVQFTD